MTTAALSIGCLLIAFSPFFTFLFLLVFSKAQLTIVVTTSAFFFLCSSLLSSLIYLPFSSFLGTDSNWNLVIIIPSSVVSQTFLRCCFVHLYHRVENVVKKSIDQERLDSSSPPSETETNGHNDSKEKLRLELNDKTCALAAGCGFGGMHTILLYGTLLASETGRKGTLYQSSCSVMPSLVNSACMAFFFGILDLIWMMLCFYGMRRLSPGMEGGLSESTPQWSMKRNQLGGKAALLIIVFQHLAASLTTTTNQLMEKDGCLVSLPILAFIVVLSLFTFIFYVPHNWYMPDTGRRNNTQHNHLVNSIGQENVYLHEE